jgi:hypothetical protein
MAWKLPAKLHLPSGKTVRLSDTAAASACAALSGETETRGPFARALALLAADGVLSGDGGSPLDVSTLSVRDVHTLRALLARAGHAPEEPAEFSCENCGEAFTAAPSALLEAAPFVDGELGDPELDAPFPFGEPLPIPKVGLPAARPRSARRRPHGLVSPAATAGAGPEKTRARSGRDARFADTVTFTERTADEARALFRVADALIAGRARSLRITPAIVIGMGVVALGNERRTPVLAESIAGASNAAWARIVELWHDAAYPRRLFGVHRCGACGARNDLDVPLWRELAREPPSRESGSRAGPRQPFPDLDAFEALVRADAARVYAARGVRNIDLFVDAGVPACDDGGEPLLGSYVPGALDEDLGVPRPPEVRLYYRTFRSEHEADPGFDLEGEIHETIDHEIEHHLNHLAGADPMDEAEHAAIDQEEIRRIGSREAARRGRRALAADLLGFVRTAWPLLLALLIAAAITWWSQQ